MPLASGFAATADATVSFDGQRVVFAARPKATDPWQIWEMALAGGAPALHRLRKDRRHHTVLPARGSHRLFTEDACRFSARHGGARWRRSAAAHLWNRQPRGMRRAARRPRSVRVGGRSLYGVFRRQRCRKLPLRSRSGPPRRETALLRRHRVRKRRPPGPLHFGARRATPAHAAEGRVCRAGGRTLARSLAGLLPARFHSAARSIHLGAGPDPAAEGPGVRTRSRATRRSCSPVPFPNATRLPWAIGRAPISFA